MKDAIRIRIRIRIGIVGLGTSHVEVFAGLLSNPDDPNFVPWGRLVTGYPGGSTDFEKSASRVDGFPDLLTTKFGVEMVDSPEAVAEASNENKPQILLNPPYPSAIRPTPLE
jgi:hypothetical protein